MKKLNKLAANIILVSIISTLINVVCKAQTPLQMYPTAGPPYVEMGINNPVTPAEDVYKGRDGVTLLPGTLIPTNSKVFLDPSIQAPVTYNSNPNAGFESTLPDLDKDLDVGTIPGQASVNLLGGASYTIPFDFPKGSGGVVPQISLTYNSGGGMGIAGLGWNLNGLHAITRMGRNLGDDGRITGVTLSNDDWFSFDGSKLIPETQNGMDNMVYRTQIESFSRIVSHTSDIEKGPDWWEIITKDGTKIEIGKNANSKLVAAFMIYAPNPAFDPNLPSWFPNNPEKILVTTQRNLMWMVNKVTDRSGNYISFEYDNKDNKELVIKKIIYSGNASNNVTADCEINFYYSISSSKESFDIANAKIERTLILRQVESKINGITFNKYDFDYVKNFMWEFLASIQVKNKDGRKFNKTVFNYEQDFIEEPCTTLKNSSGNTYISLSDNASQVISLDYNGDGLKDLVTVKDGFGGSFGWKLYKNLGDGKFEQVDDFSFPNIVPGFINPSSSIGFLNNKNLMKQVVDFDGNGLEDFYLELSFDIVSGNATSRTMVGYVFTSNGSTMDASIAFNPSTFNPNQFKVHTFLADMNGDSRTDLLTCRSLDMPGFSPQFTNFFTFKDIANNQDITVSNHNHYDFSQALTINRSTNGVQVVDGIIEIVSSGGSSYNNFLMLKLDANTLNFYGSINYHFGNCADQVPIFQYLGDFNGDGYTDKLVYFNGTWTQMSLIESGYNSTIITPGFLSPENCNNHLFAADVNADGKSDVVEVFNSGGSIFLRVSYLINGYWSPISTIGMGNSVNLGSFSNFRFESVHFTDIDGDGTNDMLFTAGVNYNLYWYVHYFKRSLTNCFLKTVQDGLGKRSNFIFELASKGVVFRDYSQNYPYPNNIIGISGRMVKILENDNGLGGFFKQSYFYKNPVINRQGKGFLGYRTTTITDIDNGLKSTTEQLLITNSSTASNVAMLIPVVSDVKTINDDLLTLTNYNINTQPTIINTFANSLQNNQGIIRSTFIIKSIGSETFNITTGGTTTTTSVTDNDGNTTSTTTNINNGLQVNVVNIEYDSDLNHRHTVAYLPKKITKTSTRGGGSNSAVTDYTYNNNHELVTETNNDPEPNNNTNYTNTITYEYYPGGSLKKQIVTNDFSSNIKEYFYDQKFRNLVKEINTLGQQSLFTYDPIGNTLLSSKGITNLTSFAEYDGWFRTKKTISPNGVVAESKYEWADANEINGSHPIAITTNLQNIVYKVTSTVSGEPKAVTYYDVLGRAIFTASESITNTQYSGVIYNNRGKVFQEVGTYQNASDDPEMVTTYTYTNLDRKVKSSTVAGSMGLQSTTEETGYNAGTTEVTITKPDGQTEKRYTDASGKLVKVIDNQGLAIEYEYNNVTTGNKNEIITKVGGAITTHAVFDEAGNQISLFDKQAGETTYEYDGAGQMTKQIDPVGHVYTFTYKPDGRIETKVGGEGTYTYIYEETSNNGKNKLKELQGPNGSIKYYYNNLQRLIKKEEIYPWETYTSNYEYDMYGNQTKYIYPNGFAVKSIYDAKGYLTKMERADNGSLIWQLNETNFADAITKYEYGNGVQVTNIYDDLGRLKETQIPNVIDYIRYGIHLQSGNTTSRSIKLPNIAAFVESFTYNENRLESHTYNRTNAPIIETNYDNYGKIKDKTDVGTLYTYNGRNRLLDIENPQNTISTTEQNIIFNSFKRPQTISESDYELTYTYGPDQERIKGEWKKNGASEKIRIYASNFEINEIVGGPKHEICYISSPNGLCAMYVKDINSGLGSLHYTYSDNLGSILAVTDENGTIEARQNFDAWGRRRNAITYDYLDQNTPDIHIGLPGLNTTNPYLPPWLYRGYTGHEMLDEFTLINMNARLYDPVVGMMLSCDNYVQDATNTQNYHRYAYCFNNPLKYTDPSGNYAIADDIAAAVIGGTLNVIGNWKNIDNFGQGAAYFGIGALGGWVGLYTAGAGGGAVTAIGNGLMQGQTGKEIVKGAFIGAAAGLAGYGITSGLGSFNYGYDKIGNDLLRYGYKASISAGVGFASGVGGSLAGQTVYNAIGLFQPGEFTPSYDLNAALQGGINGALTGAAISIGYSAYDFVTWDRFSGEQKVAILNSKHGKNFRYASEKVYDGAFKNTIGDGTNYNKIAGFTDSNYQQSWLTDAGLMSRSVADMTYYHEHKHGLQVKAGNDPRLGEKAAYEFEKYQINSSTPDRYIKTTNSNYKYYGGKGAVYDSNYSNMLFNIFR